MTGERARAVVVCIGNDLVGDDAVGWRVHERLAAGALPAGARLVLLGLGGLRLIDELEGEDTLVVCDAVQLGAPVGTVHVLDWDRLPAAPGQAVSAHGIGVREAIAVGRLVAPERMPGRVVLVGVEGRSFDELGAPLSPEVAASVDRAVAAVAAAVTAVAEGAEGVEGAEGAGDSDGRGGPDAARGGEAGGP